ncbi:hypothetical protein [Palpita vitrealis nucleopolyhedrovirus]|uniref:Uncharacterized protein n=1 Tax=Palpita vitrealis nucleopolyhedrovirus TaxID=2951960 RepID=A0AAE9LNM2_9ABAC|nr:hypothetical protein [Palpita vitrealis nucleopolyhedrovirus]
MHNKTLTHIYKVKYKLYHNIIYNLSCFTSRILLVKRVQMSSEKQMTHTMILFIMYRKTSSIIEKQMIHTMTSFIIYRVLPVGSYS